VFEPYTTAGECRLAKGCVVDGQLVAPLRPVTIWHVAGWRKEAARAARQRVRLPA
jgi:hypothetical protein